MIEVLAIVVLFFIEAIGGLFVLYLRANTYSKKETDEIFRVAKTCDMMHRQTEEKLNMQIDPLKLDISQIKQAIIDLSADIKLLTKAIYVLGGKDV